MGDTTFVESTGHQRTSESSVEEPDSLRWIIAPDFRKIQEKHGISSGNRKIPICKINAVKENFLPYLFQGYLA